MGEAASPPWGRGGDYGERLRGLEVTVEGIRRDVDGAEQAIERLKGGADQSGRVLSDHARALDAVSATAKDANDRLTIVELFIAALKQDDERRKAARALLFGRIRLIVGLAGAFLAAIGADWSNLLDRLLALLPG